MYITASIINELIQHIIRFFTHLTCIKNRGFMVLLKSSAIL